MRDLTYRGKYGKKMDWRNPDGSDDVSILLDLQGRPAVPQPPEWRRVSSDWMPTGVYAVTAAHSAPVSAVTGDTVPAVTDDTTKPTAQSLLTGLGVEVKGNGIGKGLGVAVVAESGKSVEQSLPTPTPANGGIEWDKGEWRGLTDAQCARWQEMFSDLALPDQLDRAAAWLSAQSADARKASLAGGGEAFLVRWLLRESRGTTRNSHGGADA
jgi:hypothetical protein